MVKEIKNESHDNYASIWLVSVVGTVALLIVFFVVWFSIGTSYTKGESVTAASIVTFLSIVMVVINMVSVAKTHRWGRVVSVFDTVVCVIVALLSYVAYAFLK